MINEELIERLESHQQNLITKLEELLVKQAEDHNRYCKESSDRMRSLNDMMVNYIEIQKRHLDEYVKNIDTLVKSRDLAQQNAEKALNALMKEQEKSDVLMRIVERMQHACPSAQVSVNTIK